MGTHHLFLVLLALDVLLVVVSIALEIEYLHSRERGAAKMVDVCLESVSNHSSSASRRMLGSGAAVDFSSCAHFSSYSTEEWLHTLEQALAEVSLSILVVFAIENVLLLAALRTAFLLNFFHTLDLVVVVLSITFEVMFSAHPEGWLLIIARSWRFARIGHGFVEASQNRSDALDTSIAGAIGRKLHPARDTITEEQARKCIERVQTIPVEELLRLLAEGPPPKRRAGADETALRAGAEI